MLIRKNYFPGKGNVKIYYGEYLPEKNLKGIFVFSHGIYETFEVYEYLAKRFVRNGIGFISYDYRGFGKSEGKRGYVGSYKDWLEDLDILFQILKKYKNEIPVFYGAYSMGTIISLRHIIQSQPSITGIVLGATGYLFSIPILFVCKLAGLINKIFPNHYLEIPVVRGKIRNSFIKYGHKKKGAENHLYPSIGDALLKCMNHVHEHIHKIEFPVYIQCANDDFFFRKRNELFKVFKSGDKGISFYNNCKHDIYKEAMSVRKVVYADLIRWIDRRCSK